MSALDDVNGHMRHDVAHITMRVTFRDGTYVDVEMKDVDDAQLTFSPTDVRRPGVYSLHGTADFGQFSVEEG